MSESANAYRARNDPVDTRSDDGEEALDYECVALDDVTVFEAADWMRFLFLPTRGTMILTLR